MWMWRLWLKYCQFLFIFQTSVFHSCGCCDGLGFFPFFSPKSNHQCPGVAGKTHDENGQQKFSFEVTELGHLSDVIECVEGIQPALCVQVAIATDQLRRTPVSKTEVLELRTCLLQLTTRLLRQSAQKTQRAAWCSVLCPVLGFAKRTGACGGVAWVGHVTPKISRPLKYM